MRGTSQDRIREIFDNWMCLRGSVGSENNFSAMVLKSVRKSAQKIFIFFFSFECLLSLCFVLLPVTLGKLFRGGFSSVKRPKLRLRAVETFWIPLSTVFIDLKETNINSSGSFNTLFFREKTETPSQFLRTRNKLVKITLKKFNKHDFRRCYHERRRVRS